MWASRHAIFVGPSPGGELPEAALDRRREAELAAEEVPRLQALFDSAAEAEAVASRLQERRLGILVAGPEQPPAEDSWFAAAWVEGSASEWEFGLGTADERRTVPLAEVSSVVVVEWTSAQGLIDRALLLRAESLERPLFVRASALEPAEGGIRRVAELIDQASLGMPEAARRACRRLGPDHFPGLTGDLLPLAVAVVDALDTRQATLPRPLGVPRPSHPELFIEPTPAARVTTMALLLNGGALGLGFTGLAMAGAVTGWSGLWFLASSVATLASAITKLATGRWLAKAVLKRPPSILERLFAHSGAGIRPHLAHLGVDLAALTINLQARTTLPAFTGLADIVTVLLGMGLASSAAALAISRGDERLP